VPLLASSGLPRSYCPRTSGISCAYRVSVAYRAGGPCALGFSDPYTPRRRRQGQFARECSACWAGIRTPGQELPSLHTSRSIPGIQGRRYRHRWPQQRRSRPQELRGRRLTFDRGCSWAPSVRDTTATIRCQPLRRIGSPRLVRRHQIS
jgi:hypothetical protein